MALGNCLDCTDAAHASLAPDASGRGRPMEPLNVILKRFESPDETRIFEKGRFEVVRIHGMTIGRATYEPGWRWSVHVGPGLGESSCRVEHVGLVLSGRATAAMDDGRIFEMGPGDVFYIAPGHDSWVVGDLPYVSLHFLGAEDYASHGSSGEPSLREVT